ncbi:hypothetical protein CMI47_18870 [Candidatus Pacearchaeota archaeon]|nr:hypothetical protein [Candidatus Pacearchaeota archaeon]|tara:strand:+ start:16873 stop:17490 length:618 start_codon:yes stop_codon:yes gene_type:complete
MIDKGTIRRLILEQMDEMMSGDDSEKSVTDSVDNQIDSFLIKFEKDSMSSDEDEMMESLSSMSLKGLVVEQDAEEDAEPDEDTPEQDDDLDSNAGDEDPDDESDSESLESPKPPIDVDAFTKRVARLVMNNEVLLDVKDVIVNRAINFLLDHYDDSHVSEMKEILHTQFDISTDEDVEHQLAPFAVGAWAGGTGGLGGGGGGGTV